jgi:hypothetical protein
MTGSMRASLDGGGFEDPAWVEELLWRFAVEYFEAVDAHERSGRVPLPWVVAFDAAADPDRPVLQHLLLGINAHINYDLVRVLVDLLEPCWLDADPALRERRWRDYDEVNRVISRTVDGVQESVVEERSPFLGVADVLLGPVDEWAASRFLSRWRDRVWADACEALDERDPLERLRRLDEVERRAERRAVRLLLRG